MKSILLVLLFVAIATGFQDQSRFDFINGRIIGGHDTAPYEYPFVCSLQRTVWPYDPMHTCGATILSEEWILTAAHCVMDPPANYEVWCGRWNFDYLEPSGQYRQIDIIHSHENFTFEVMNHWDVAVLHLTQPLIFTDYVHAAEIPSTTDFVPVPQSPGIMVGWGVIRQNPTELPRIMQQVIAPIVAHPECMSALGQDSGLHISNICTGPLTGGIGVCNGDSGGPLLQWMTDRFVQIGIASWTVQPCGSPNGPSVWAGISPFLEWIQEHCDNCV